MTVFFLQYLVIDHITEKNEWIKYFKSKYFRGWYMFGLTSMSQGEGVSNTSYMLLGEWMNYKQSEIS